MAPAPPSPRPLKAKHSLRHWFKDLKTALRSKSISQTASASSPASNVYPPEDGIATELHEGASLRVSGRIPVEAIPVLDEPTSADGLSQSTIKDKAKTAWHGFKVVAKNAEAIVDGTPFKIPIAVLNKLIDATEAVIDNQELIAELLLPIGKRLTIVSEKLTQKTLPEDVKPSCDRFTNALNLATKELQEMHEQRLFKRILELGEQPMQIQAVLRRIEVATKNFELELNLANFLRIYTVKDDTEVIRLRGLRPSRDVRYPELQRDSCVKGTREGIIDKILTWCKDTSPETPAVYWLSGMAGTGKSTIAFTICERLAEDGNASRLGASFFCSRQVEGGRKRKHIIPTIAHELALKLPLFSRAILDSKVDTDPPPVKNHLQNLLVSPWDASIRDRDGLPPLVVVVDALDEVEDEDGSYFLEELIGSIERHPHHLYGLKFFVTSRRDPRIVKVAQSLPADVVFFLEELPHASAEHDIKVFLQTSLPALIHHDQLSALSKQASGLFIYAATAVRFIVPQKHQVPSLQVQEVRLKLLLETWPDQSWRRADGLAVDQLYEGVLSNYLFLMAAVEKKTNLAILQTVLCAEEPMLIPDIYALSNESEIGTEDVENVIQSLHSVLYISGHRVYSYHKSFSDFMLDPSRFADQKLAEICCPTPATRFRLATRCFHLMDSLRFNICDLPSSFLNDSEVVDLSTRVTKEIPSPLQYACRHWAAHMSRIPVDDDRMREAITVVLETWLQRLLFWMEAMNLMKVMRESYPALISAHQWLGQNIKPETLQDLVAAERLAIVFGTNIIAAATPHLYLSALAGSPRSSSLINSWLDRFPGIPIIIARLSRSEPISVFYHGNWVTSVGFSPDGLCAISGSIDGTVRIWEVATGQQLQQFDGHVDSVKSVRFSRDGQHAMSGSNDHTVRIWEVATGQQLQQFNGHVHSVKSVGFSPDGQHGISGSNDCTVRIWDVTTGQQLQQLNGHKDSVRSVGFSPDGHYVISGSDDWTVRIWEVTTGQQLQQFNGHKDWVRSGRFSPDGQHAISGSDDHTVRIWKVTTGQQLQQLNGHKNTVTSVGFSPDGQCAISGSDDLTVRIWEIATGQQLQQLDGHKDTVRSVSFSPDGQRAISGSDDDTMCIWDVTTGQRLQQPDGHKNCVTSVGFSPDGHCVISGSDDWTVCIWEVRTGQQLQQFNGHKDWVRSVGFSPDGQRAISGSSDCTVCIWDVTTGQQLQQLDGHRYSVRSVGFSPDGQHAISGSTDHTARIWEVTTGQQLQQFNGHKDYVRSVGFSPDGQRAISGSNDCTVRIWDIATGQQLQQLDGHQDWVTSVGFSPDGQCAISSSADHTARIWGVTTGLQLQQFNGHKDSVRSVGFSPDGCRAISGSNDCTVRIWDATTGQQLQQLKGYKYSVRSVGFSPDGQHAISGSADHTARIWDVTTGQRSQHIRTLPLLDPIQ
ncbi:WD40-repeat-containing domain protein [Mycena capillaripes]|nr:WD40-repeat-containing domain protein [Mycena capillaripes]